MKKILSVMLAIMMLFTALSISASAADVKPGQVGFKDTSDVVIPSGHNIIIFHFGAGKSNTALWVYDTEKGFLFKNAGEVTGDYVMLPSDENELYAGSTVFLPAVVGPDGYNCSGWQLMSYGFADTGVTYGHGLNSYWKIPAGCQNKVIEFTAIYTQADVEGDTLTTILGVLSKVFGTILGLLLFDGSAAKGTELVNSLLGSLL